MPALPPRLRRTALWLLVADLCLVALLALWALASVRVPIAVRIAAPCAAGALAAASVPAWLGLRAGRRGAVLLATLLAGLRALLALTAVCLVLVRSRLGSVLGLLACSQLLLAALAASTLLTASEHRDALR